LHHTRLVSALICAALAASCAPEPHPTATPDPLAPARTGTELVFPHGDGAPASVHAPSGSALFTVDAATGQTVQGALEGWLRTSAPYGLGSRSTLELRERRRSTSGALTTVLFEQTYRGVPLVGPAARVTVTLAGDDAISVTGRPIDTLVEYDGQLRRLSEADAASALAKAYVAAQRGATAPVVEGLTLVAHSGAGTLGWAADVHEPGFDAMAIVVGAAHGATVTQQITDWYSLDHDRPVHMYVEEVGADPVDPPTVMAWDQPGSLTDSCPDPDDDDGCMVRMGTKRLSVYDYQDDNSDTPVVTTMPITHLFQPGEPWSKFLALPPSWGFNEQNMYHKAVVATDWVDPHVSAMGWDHYPNVPWTSSEPSSLLLMTSVDSQSAAGPYCGTGPQNLGALGVFRAYAFTEAEAAIVDPPHGTASLPAISICQHDESVLFHELGHYYDAHLTTGVMGSGIDYDGTCVPDTSDEAPPLAETVGDMMAVALYAGLYPDLSYDLGNTSAPCTLGELGPSGSVHGDGCGGPVQFDDQRPTSVANGACNRSAGYGQSALAQAWWEFLSGKTCATTAPYVCTTASRSPDLGLQALLFALNQGNGQSYKELVYNMAVYVMFNGTQAELDRFVEAFSHHGLMD
jgi:hypothetical protein